MKIARARRILPGKSHFNAGRLVSAALSAALVLGLLVVGAGTSSAVPTAAVPKTIVSLTFDDANLDQLAASKTLKAYGMSGTFYLVSGFIGAANYLTLDNVKTMIADGQEVAAHTVSHPDLTLVSTDEATRQICNDRVNWSNWGITTTDFAYPFASVNTAVEAAVKSCGLNSARGLGDIKTRFSCPDCPVGETVPPADPYLTKAPDEVDSTWTLADLKQSVTQAEAAKNGSWVQLTFHHICASGCQEPTTTPTIFNQFIAWLAPRAASKGTQVRTVKSVIGGVVAPVVAGPVAPEAAAGVNAISNPSFETFNSVTGLPQGFTAGAYGSNTPAWSVSTDAHTGTSAVQMVVTNYVDGEAKLLPTLDLGQYAPTVTPGKTYNLSEWYKSTASTQFSAYYRNALGTWAYWTSSPYFATATAYTQASWTTPAVPVGATAISFGLNLFTNGTLITDDISMVSGAAPAAAAARAPAVSAPAPQPALVNPGASTGNGDGTSPAGQPRKVKGAKVTEHSLVPGPARGGTVPSPGLKVVVPGPTQLGHSFVISPELTIG